MLFWKIRISNCSNWDSFRLNPHQYLIDCKYHFQTFWFESGGDMFPDERDCGTRPVIGSRPHITDWTSYISPNRNYFYIITLCILSIRFNRIKVVAPPPTAFGSITPIYLLLVNIHGKILGLPTFFVNGFPHHLFSLQISISFPTFSSTSSYVQKYQGGREFLSFNHEWSFISTCVTSQLLNFLDQGWIRKAQLEADYSVKVSGDLQAYSTVKIADNRFVKEKCAIVLSCTIKWGLPNYVLWSTWLDRYRLWVVVSRSASIQSNNISLSKPSQAVSWKSECWVRWSPSSPKWLVKVLFRSISALKAPRFLFSGRLLRQLDSKGKLTSMSSRFLMNPWSKSISCYPIYTFFVCVLLMLFNFIDRLECLYQVQKFKERPQCLPTLQFVHQESERAWGNS